MTTEVITWDDSNREPAMPETWVAAPSTIICGGSPNVMVVADDGFYRNDEAGRPWRLLSMHMPELT